MQQIEFQRNMKRLIEVWPNSFNDERVRLILKTVEGQNVFWFEKLVTTMIANCRQAPLPQDFIDAVVIENKKRYLDSPKIDYQQKESVLSKEDREEMFRFMKAAAQGLITREDAMKYAEIIASVLTEKGVKVEPFRNYDYKTNIWS